MCASLPTLRKFIKHFAPRLIGENYGGGSKPTGYAPGSGVNSGLRTIGGSGAVQSRTKRSQYSQFDEEDTSEVKGFNLNAYPQASRPSGVTANASSGWQDGEEAVWPDNSSEQAIVKNDASIVQTKTVTVEITRKKQG